MITNLYFDHVLATDTKEAAILRGRGRSRRVTPEEKLVRANFLISLMGNLYYFNFANIVLNDLLNHFIDSKDYVIRNLKCPHAWATVS